MQPATDEKPDSETGEGEGETVTFPVPRAGDPGFSLNPGSTSPPTFTAGPPLGSGPSLSPPPPVDSEPRERAGQTSGSASEAGNEADVAEAGASGGTAQSSEPIASAGPGTAEPFTVTPEGGSAIGGVSTKEESPPAPEPEMQLPPTESATSETNGPIPLAPRLEGLEGPPGGANPFVSGPTGEANPNVPVEANLDRPGIRAGAGRRDQGAVNNATGEGGGNNGGAASGTQFGQPGSQPSDFYGPIAGKRGANADEAAPPSADPETPGDGATNGAEHDQNASNMNGAEMSSNGATAPAQDPGQQGHYTPGEPADPGPGVPTTPRENSAKAPYDPALGAAEQRAREAAAAAAGDQGERNPFGGVVEAGRQLGADARQSVTDQVDAAQDAVEEAQRDDTSGFSQDGRDRWVSMEDWKRLNDRDGDGMVDRNAPPRQEDDQAGAPPGAVGDGVPAPDGDFNGGPGGRIRDGGVVNERPGLAHPLDPGHFAPPAVGPGVTLPPGGRVVLPDKDGDGRPDLRVDPGDFGTRPGFEAPTEYPGLEVPVGLRPPGPGPRFDPDDNLPPPPHADPPAGTMPPPTGHGGHEQPPAGNGGYQQPSGGHPGTQQPPVGDSGGSPPPVADAGQAHEAPATGSGTPPDPSAHEPGGPQGGLDVFYPDASAEAAPANVEPAGQPVEAVQPPHLAVGGGQFEPSLAADTAGTPGPIEEVPALSPEVAAMVETIRRAIWSIGGDHQPAGEDEPGGGAAVIERIVQAVRDVIFVNNQEPSDEALAAQLSLLDPDDLAELERFAQSQDDEDGD